MAFLCAPPVARKKVAGQKTQKLGNEGGGIGELKGQAFSVGKKLKGQAFSVEKVKKDRHYLRLLKKDRHYLLTLPAQKGQALPAFSEGKVKKDRHYLRAFWW